MTSTASPSLPAYLLPPRVAARVLRSPSPAALPEGPPFHPLYQIYRWLRDPVGYLTDECARYGERFTLRFPRLPPIVAVSDPESIRDIFTGSTEVFFAGEANHVLEPLMGAHSVLLLDGAEHLRHRRLLLPPFHGERTAAYAEVMRDVTERFASRWPEDASFPFHDTTQAITLEVILRAVFGVDEEGELRTLVASLGTLMKRSANPLWLVQSVQRDLGPLTPWRAMMRDKEKSDAILYALIRRRRAMPEDALARRSDILATLLLARDEAGTPLTDEEVHDELVTMLIAGHETSATALAWCAHRLFAHPEAAAHVRAEVDACSPGERLDAGAIGKMSYLDAFVKETLRLNPIVPMVGRVLKAPAVVGGREYAQGTVLAPCIYLAHRNPRVWDEPEAFRPERFLGRRISPYEYLPFGGGARRCIGAAFATQEIKVTLATILHGFELSPVPGHRTRLVRRSITFSPSEGMPLKARRRARGSRRRQAGS